MPSSAYASAAGCFPWLDPWPPPAVTDDANAWVTGLCWLYCRRGGVRVLWIGSIHTPGARGDLYGCGSCIAELDHMVRLQVESGDGTVGRAHTGTVTVPPYLVDSPAERPMGAGRRAGGADEAQAPGSGTGTGMGTGVGTGVETAAETGSVCRHVVCRGGKFCDSCGCRIYL